MSKAGKCPKCGKDEWMGIPDSCAIASPCGYVLVGGADTPSGYEPGATLQQWAKDLYEAKQKDKNENLHNQSSS